MSKLRARSMKAAFLGCALIFIFVLPSRAQGPIAAGYSPGFTASAGYSYVNLGIPGQSRLSIQGGTGGLTVDLSTRLGIELDGSYARATNVYGSGHAVDLLSFMGGPTFYLRRGRRVDFYVHGLAGVARETGVNYDSNGDLFLGFVTKLAWAAGGGVEYRIDRQLSVRLGCDYLDTGIFNDQGAIKRENDIRTFVGFTYRFGGRRP
jgi:opacity protein-like surface antigen